MKALASLFLLSCVACIWEPLKDTAHSEPQRVYYQVFLRSFCDSNGDGIGDVVGLTGKLDYLSDLGINGLWLMPVHPSGSYHKYDVRDFYGIDPEYGTMEEFKALLREAHKRDIKVVIDLVLNHTDDEHPWFQDALGGQESQFRPFYLWASPDSITEAKHLWHDQPADGTKVNSSKESFYGFFWKGMPDLNYDHPPLRDSILQIGRYWLKEVGVDGFRLDAALLIYPYYEGPQAAYLQKTLAWWDVFHKAMEETRPNTFLVGEVWQSDTVLLPFLSSGLDACFHFDLSNRIIETVLAEKDSFDLAGQLLAYRQQLAAFPEPNPERTDAIFLSNHDQDRLRSRFDGSWEKAGLAASILLTLPGTPFIYYGEELGMLGKKPDKHIREPFPWALPGTDPCQTAWQSLEYNMPEKTPPLSDQQFKEGSLWKHYRKLIHFRNTHPVMGQGEILPFEGKLPAGMLGYYRVLGGKRLLVLHQLAGRRSVLTWKGAGAVLFSTHEGSGITGDALRMAPFSTLVLEQKS